MERSCRWRGMHWPARISAEFELNLWTATDPITGETEIKLYNLEFTPLLTARLVPVRSEEHTSELQSLMRISYAVFCLKKKKKNKTSSVLISITSSIDHNNKKNKTTNKTVET